MSTRIRVLRATTAQRLTFTPESAEIIYDKDLNAFYGGDGVTVGGNAIGATLSNEQVEDIIGGLIGDSSTINVTYDDAGNVLTMDVNQAALNTSLFNNDAGFQIASQVTATVNNAISTHEGLADPHPQYLTQAEADAIYMPLSGGDTDIGKVVGYQYFTGTVSFTNNEPTFINVYTYNSPSLTIGTYLVEWLIGVEPSNTGSNDIFRVSEFTTELSPQVSYEDEGKDTGADIIRTIAIEGELTVTAAGAKQINLRGAQDGSGTTVVKSGRVKITRVA